MPLQANAIKLEALWTYLYHEDASMEELQHIALVAAYKAHEDRTALNTGEATESKQPGQDHLINMSAQQVGPNSEFTLFCDALQGHVLAGQAIELKTADKYQLAHGI